MLVLAGCASPTPTPAPTPTPTISVYEVYPPSVADLIPQSVYNCRKDREAERWERLSPEEQAKQNMQVARSQAEGSGAPASWRRVWYAQELSCWALHASDEQYAEASQTLGSPVMLLPSWQLCIEEEMRFVEGVLATSLFIIDGDFSVYSESALQCFPDDGDSLLGVPPPVLTACGLGRNTTTDPATLNDPYVSLRASARGLSCWALHSSDAEYRRFREGQGLTEPIKVQPSWQLCLEEAVGYDAAVEHLYNILVTPRGQVEFPAVWSQCTPEGIG